MNFSSRQYINNKTSTIHQQQNLTNFTDRVTVFYLTLSMLVSTNKTLDRVFKSHLQVQNDKWHKTTRQVTKQKHQTR